MIRLVLDKSVLKAAPQGLLGGYADRFHFVLTSVLLEEVVTEGLSERGTTELQYVDANFCKIANETPGEWSWFSDAVRYELATGNSARFAPKRSCADLLEYRDALTPDLHSQVQEEESVHAALMNLDAFPEERARATEALGAISDRTEFFVRLDDQLLERSKLSIRATISWKAWAIEKRIITPGSFVVHDRMLCFGIRLVSEACWLWQVWRRRDGQMGQHGAANTLKDFFQIAYMAIADGLLSVDKNMLRLAWVCWPKKREHLYTYDKDTREIVPWKPSWES